MRLGLYLEHMHDNRLGGVGTYARRLAEVMATAVPGLRLTLLAATAADHAWSRDFALRHAAAGVRVRRIRHDWRLDVFLTRLGYLGFQENHAGGPWPALLRALNYIEWQCRGLDLVYSPNQALPLPYWRKPALFTLHDVQELHLPANFTSGERASRAVYNALLQRGARGVVVSFEHVREDLLRFFQFAPGRIHLVPFPVEAPAAPVQAEPYVPPGVNGPFFLYPAQTWPHKNHALLLDAFARMPSRSPHLVFTGRATPHAEALRARAEALGLSARVHWLGLVSDAQLAGLYQACRAVVLPTRYEAGGFPLYEAIRHGTPALCSTATSLPGVMGSPDYVFSPDDPDRLAGLLERLVTDEVFWQACRAHIQSRFAKLHEWAGDCARGLSTLISTLEASHG